MKTSKNQTSESKSKYGTMTALSDANQDYSSSTSSGTNSTQSSSSMSEYGTMTALEDANQDYSSSSQSSSKSTAKKKNSMTASYDSNGKP